MAAAEIRMSRRVPLELLVHAHLQQSPLADELGQLVALLPALEAVLAHPVRLTRIALFVRQSLERMPQAIEDRGDVIVELGPGERRGDGALGRIVSAARTRRLISRSITGASSRSCSGGIRFRHGDTFPARSGGDR
jgi:hypothetical protein